MAKSAPKLQIRNFLPVTTSGMDKRDPAMSMTVAVNRLGATVTDVGKILTSSHQARLDAAYQVQGRRSLAQDRAREKKIEKKTAENIDKESEARGYKKGGSGIFGLLSPLIQPLIQFAGTIATFFALDFLSKPENKEMIKTGFSWIGKWLGTVWKVGSWGFSMIYDGLFDPDGNDGPVMRALKVIGGLAGIFVAGRILRPWKIAGDISKLSKLFKGNRKAGQLQKQRIQQRQMQNTGTRPGLKGKPGMKPGGGGKLLGKMGKFFKSPVGAGALSGVFAFGSRLAAGDKLNVAAGGGIGAAVGTTAVTALLVPVLGPFAPLVGGVLGGFIGDKIGAFLGESMEPILKPMGDFFKNIALPIWKAYLMPLVEPLKDLFEPLKALFGIIIDAVAPIATKAFSAIMDFIAGPLAQGALDGIVWIIEKAAWFIKNGVKLAQGTANNFARAFGSDAQKAIAQAENEDYDVRNLTKQLEKIKKRQAKGKGGSRSIWFGVDGVIRTSNGAPGMHIGNGHGNPLGSTNDEKAKHWEEVLIPHAKKKAREAAIALQEIEMAQPQTDMVSDPSIANKGKGPDDGPVPPGGRLDFQGHGDGATGVLRLFDGKNKKVGQWQAISGTYGTAGTSQKQRRNVSGAYYPLPDGTYPLVGFAEHGNVKGIGIWSTFINNMSGTIGKRSAIQLHNDINDNGTAGCVGVTLGGVAGNKKDKDFVKKYKKVMPKTIRVAIAKGAKKLSSGPPSTPDNRSITSTDLNSTKTSELTSSSQRQDTELTSGDSSQVVVMQPIIKTVKETVGVDNTQVIHTDLGSFTSGGF